MIGLTEGYKNKFPLFHKLFLNGVEKSGVQSGDLVIGSTGDRKSKAKFKIEIQRRRIRGSDHPMARSPDHPMIS